MVHCCVPFCKTNSKTKPRGVSFHEFPSEKGLRQLWLNAVRRRSDEGGNKPWLPNDRSVVCSRHFADSDFKTGLKIRQLIQGTVPSVFPGYPPRRERKVYTPRRILVRPVSTPMPTPIVEKDSTTDTNSDSRKQEGTATNSGPQPSPVDNNIDMVDKVTEDNLPRKTKDVSVRTVITTRSMDEKEHKYRVIQRQVQRMIMRVATLESNQKKLVKENEALRQKLADANLDELENECRVGNVQAEFLAEQLKCFNHKKPRWSDRTVQYCILWHDRYPAGYRFVRDAKLLNLPSRLTLKRYAGETSGETSGISIQFEEVEVETSES